MMMPRVPLLSGVVVLVFLACLWVAGNLTPARGSTHEAEVGLARASRATLGSTVLSDAPWESAVETQANPEERLATDPGVDLVASLAAGSPAVALEAPDALEARLRSWALAPGAGGELAAMFGLPLAQAREVLFPVTKQRSLPLDYRPNDLTTIPGQRSGVFVRALIVGDTEALLRAAARDGVSLAAMSGFRSSATQAALYEGRARDRFAQAAGTMTWEEARERANQGTALPGQSQHQLGTAIDFSTGAVGFQLTPNFAGTPAAAWLRAHAWEFGFVLPYTELGRPRTGYIAEPWHLRWVGRPLAEFLHAHDYLESADIVVDDWLEAIERLLDGPSSPAS